MEGPKNVPGKWSRCTTFQSPAVIDKLSILTIIRLKRPLILRFYDLVRNCTSRTGSVVWPVSIIIDKSRGIRYHARGGWKAVKRQVSCKVQRARKTVVLSKTKGCETARTFVALGMTVASFLGSIGP